MSLCKKRARFGSSIRLNLKLRFYASDRRKVEDAIGRKLSEQSTFFRSDRPDLSVELFIWQFCITVLVADD